ncbi:T9SS type A sorting domain-containing protein [candidate division KSB1 bacterium]|nr:T9SS type A sorting domain-containing protein [candidate division KSB1 bacterium]
MKKSSILTYGVLFILASFVVSPGTSIFAQTNFVKYNGNPILPLGNPGEWDNTEAAYANVHFDGEMYRMWYSGALQENTYRIGYAISSDGVNWMKDAINPVLDVGAPNTFDSINLWLPYVLFNGTNYEMWYSGGLTSSGIGYATSSDPVSWIRQSASPVLDKGASGAWDDSYAFLPVVLQSDTLYQMWYTGRSASGIRQTGYANSSDGMNWSKNQNNPVLPAGDAGSWDANAAAASSVIFENGQYHMWYHGDINSDLTGVAIGYATSPDGINWTKHPDNPILQAGPENWDGKNVWFPRVIKDGHRYRMWYTGTLPGTSLDRLGYAEDFSNAAHVDSIRVNSETVVAGSQTVSFWAHITNPHGEDLTARALIESDDGSISASVDLVERREGLWRGEWAPPAELHNYKLSVALNNITANYVHNSMDWGVFDSFSPILDSNPLSHTFTQIAAINEGNDAGANNVIAATNGAILLANGKDGLRAYSFDGTSFSNIAHVNDGGDAMGVAEGADGTIFLANGEDGLRAYSFDGTAFANLAHIDEGGSAMDVALDSDGTVFLANGEDGLRAYSFDGSSFVSTAHLNNFSVENEARGIAVAPDNAIFLFRDGVWAFNYTGSNFMNTWHNSEIGNSKGIAFGADGTIFLGSWRHIHAFSHEDTSFMHVASDSINELWSQGIAAMNETIFLAGSSSPVNSGVLAACSFNGSSFNKTAYLRVDSRDIALLSGDTILVTSGFNGLIAYTYSKNPTTAVDNEYSKFPIVYRLYQNYPNPFNPTTTINYALPIASHVEVKIYNTLGQEVRTLVNSMKPAGSQQVVWDGQNNSGNIVPSGVYFYQLQVGALVETRKMLLLR